MRELVKREALHLTLLRHGRSLADDEEVCEGRYDSPLTNVGVEQAKKLAAYWQAHPPGFECVVCSSLVRAHKTACIVADALGLEVETSDDWREFDNGPVAGLPFAEAKARYPVPAFRGRFKAFTPDGGESAASLMRRAQCGLERLVQSSLTRALVVAHGGVLNMALRDLLGASRASFSFGDTAFAEVMVRRDADHAVLKSVNRRPHLEENHVG